MESVGGDIKKDGSNHSDVALQHTGLNCYIVIILYCVYLALTSSVYYNWPSLFRFLVAGGIHECNCPNSGVAHRKEDMSRCDEQRLRISQLLLLAKSCDGSISAITGFLADRFSQRYVLLAGNVFLCIGWSLLAFNNDNDTAIALSFCCIGFCGSCAYMSALNVSELFPKNRALAIYFINFADDLSTNVPLILNCIHAAFGRDRRGFRMACISFLLFASLLILTISFTAVPVKSWSVYINEYNSTASTTHKYMADENYSDIELKLVDEDNGVSKTGMLRGEENKKGKLNSIILYIHGNIKPLIRHLANPRFIILLYCLVVTNFSNLFSQNLFLKYYEDDESVKYASEIFLSVKFIPGLLFAHLFDMFPIFWVTFVLNTFSILAYILLYIGGSAAGYIFCFFLMIVICVDFSMFILYVSISFPSEYTSGIAGFALFADGMISLLTCRVNHIMIKMTTSLPILIMIMALTVRLIMYAGLQIYLCRTTKQSGAEDDIMCDNNAVHNNVISIL